MFPEIITIGGITIHSYGFMIMLGAIMGFWYMSTNAKKELGINPEKIQTLAILIILGAFVGGKALFYLEDPGHYFNPPSNMLKNFRTGFVFYGSLLFALPLSIWFFMKEKWPVWAMLDRLAITATIIHAFGRMGCFLAGCCYGLPTDSALAVTFTHEHSKAKPLGEALHPTQLYSVFLITSIFAVLLMFKRHKRFEGQLFFVYIMLYAAGRAIIEVFRGDIRRGFIIEGWLSHSQFISILLIAGAAWVYFYLSKRPKTSKPR